MSLECDAHSQRNAWVNGSGVAVGNLRRGSLVSPKFKCVVVRRRVPDGRM